MLLAAAGADPVAELFTAAALRDPMSAGDQAAVIDSRIHDINKSSIGRGPLPWLPGIPDRIANDPNWGPYLDARSRLVAQLADQVRSNAEGEAPAWAAVRRNLVPAELIADVQLWRAATQVDPIDLRPTGPPHSTTLPDFSNSDSTSDSPLPIPIQTLQWRQLLATEAPARPQEPIPAGTRGKVDQPHPGRLRRHPARAVGRRRRPLPDDHPAAALWWRILDQLPQTPNKAPQPPTPAHRRRRRPRPHATSSDPSRARCRRPRSARAAETSRSPRPRCGSKWSGCCRNLTRIKHQARRLAPRLLLPCGPLRSVPDRLRTGQLRGRILRDRRRSVPECVHDAECLEMEPALLNHHVVVAYTTADASSKYEGEFVFVSAGLRDDQLTGLQYCRLAREPSARVTPP